MTKKHNSSNKLKAVKKPYIIKENNNSQIAKPINNRKLFLISSIVLAILMLAVTITGVVGCYVTALQATSEQAQKHALFFCIFSCLSTILFAFSFTFMVQEIVLYRKEKNKK